MAARDIMPFNGPFGGHSRVIHFRLNASETFDVGEPVSVNADGELTESDDDPLDADIMGIAMGGPGAGQTNPATGANWATGDLVPVVIPDSNSLFITRNYSEAGSAFNDTAPVVARIGDECGLSLISGSWGVDISTTNNTCRIIDLLNENKESIQQSGETLDTSAGQILSAPAYYVVFQIIGHQSTTPGAVDAPVA